MARPLLCLLAVAVVIGGCGGHSSFTIKTDGGGSLRGVRTIPEDGERYVETDITISVFWVSGYEPPAEFRFALIGEDGEKVLTKMRKSNDPNTWTFEPTWDLDFDTLYTIEITADGSERKFVFRTEYGDRSSPASTNEHKIPDPAASAPQREHTVKTRY